MSYEVIHPFRDLQDTGKIFPKGRVYAIGDKFPATKRKLTDERVEELKSDKNKIGKPLIKEKSDK